MLRARRFRCVLIFILKQTLHQRKTTWHHLQNGGYKVAPLVASQLWRASQHEQSACFALSSPWSFPSRSGILLLYAVVQPWLSLQ